MDDALFDRCRRCLERGQQARRICPPFRVALAACQAGDATTAARELQALDDRPLYLAVQYLGISWLEAGRSVQDFEPCHALIRSRIKNGTLNWISDIGRDWSECWLQLVGRHLPTADLGLFAHPYTGRSLRRACEIWCGEGKPDKGLTYADAISAYYKEERARALALVGATFSEGQRRRDTLANALDVNLESLIQTGYEETAAFAGIVDVLAKAGFAADDEVVTQACKMLAKLNKRGVDRDARSAGVLLALFGAAERAGAARDRAWLDLAISLVPRLWDQVFRARGAIAIALAQRALGLEQDAAKTFASVDSAFLGGPQLAASLVAPFPGAEQAFAPFLGNPYPIWLPWVAHAAGADLDLAFGAALREINFTMGQAEIYAQMLALDYPHRHALANKLNAEERCSAHLQAIELAHRMGANERYQQLLADLDFSAYKGYAERGLLALDQQNLSNLEALVNGACNASLLRNRTTVLTTIATAHLKLGCPDAACRCIQAALLPPVVDDRPGWQPPSRRRRDPEEELTLEPGVPLDVPFAEALRAAENTPDDGNSQRLRALHELARQVAGDRESLARVLAKMKKTPTMRDRDTQGVKKCRLGHVQLLMDDVDAALDTAASVTQCRISGWGGWRLTMLISDWFAQHPDAFTPGHARRMLEVLGAHHPQDLPGPIIHVGAQIIRDVPPAARTAAVKQLLDLQSCFKQRGDQSVVQAALAIAYAELGLREDFRQAFLKAVELVEHGDAFYHPQLQLVRALLRATRNLILPERSEWLQRVLRTVKDYPYRIVWCWESAMFDLFAAGDQSTFPELLASGGIASEVADGFKRSWRAEAAHLAPQPVEAVMALFDDIPKNADHANEQVLRVAEALERENKQADALRIRAFLDRKV